MAPLPALGPIDSALFDLDGVIADSREPFVTSVNATLVSQGLAPWPEEELYRFLGPPTHATFEAILGDEHAELVDCAVRAYREHYRHQTMLRTPMFEGVGALIEDLAARMPLVVATSKAQEMAEILIEAFGLRGSFLAVIGPALAAVNEPKAVTVGRALEALPPQARHPVMIGDTRFDAIAAAANGIPTIGVLWGIGEAQELSAAGAAALVSSPAELGALLRGAREAA